VRAPRCRSFDICSSVFLSSFSFVLRCPSLRLRRRATRIKTGSRTRTWEPRASGYACDGEEVSTILRIVDEEDGLGGPDALCGRLPAVAEGVDEPHEITGLISAQHHMLRGDEKDEAIADAAPVRCRMEKILASDSMGLIG
jgi:hypothetical protein